MPNQFSTLWTNRRPQANFTSPKCCRFRPARLLFWIVIYKRRKRAGKMFERGARQIDVAKELEVSRETARRWYEVWDEGGTEALAQIGQRGRPRGRARSRWRRWNRLF